MNAQIFVVGASRSGTTMLAQILGRHSEIHKFRELHFFGALASAEEIETNAPLSDVRQREILARLLTNSRQGLFAKTNTTQYERDIAFIRDRAKGTSPMPLYSELLDYEVSKAGKTIACEQTPRCVFYLSEILEYFPNAKIINMVRDPRDVMLSQKRKWTRRHFGQTAIPFFERLRTWSNYHPYITPRLWSAAVDAAELHVSDERMTTVKYEDLLRNPNKTIDDLCGFLDLQFSAQMLDIPHEGSSNIVDTVHKLGVDGSRQNLWKNGGLSKREIAINQRIVAGRLSRYGYRPEPSRFHLVAHFLAILSLPIKGGTAFFLNLHRSRGIFQAFRKRFRLIGSTKFFQK